MNDNSTPYLSCEYDRQIIKATPFYENFHNSAIDLVKTVNPSPTKWLDTGCGTGTFVQKALSEFAETEFFLADPSKSMIEIARKVSDNVFETGTSQLNFPQENFDVITAILSHHFMNQDERRLSTEKSFLPVKAADLF